MCEAEEPPRCEGLGQGERQAHETVAVGDQLREEKRGLVQILAGGDLGEVGALRSRCFCRLPSVRECRFVGGKKCFRPFFHEGLHGHRHTRREVSPR